MSINPMWNKLEICFTSALFKNKSKEEHLIYHQQSELFRFHRRGAGEFFICFAVIILFGICSEISFAREKSAAPEQLPDVIIPFEPGDGTEYIIVVEKETQRLLLYANDGKLVRLLHGMDCSTGKAKGRKLREGDLKTPEGVYFFIKKFEDKELAPIYGTGAFPTDYPNLLDQAADRTGSEIWIHGTDRPLEQRDSSGCVALVNTKLEEIGKYITLNRTPIIIADRLSYGPANANIKTGDEILRLLSEWKNALDKGTYHDYLKSYDAEYLPDIFWWTEWNKVRKRIRKAGKSLSLDLKRIVMARHKDIHVALAEQSVNFSGNDVSAGIRKFFLRKSGDAFKIIGEEYQGLPEELMEHEKRNPFITAYNDLKIVPEKVAEKTVAKVAVPADKPDKIGEKIPEDVAEIEKMIENWLRDWSSKNIKKYGSYYARDFRSRGMNRKAWMAYKNRLNSKYRYIRVSKKGDALIREKGEMCVVSFVQRYESNTFKTRAVKNLTLKQEGGEWKIFRETSRRI